MDANRLTPDLHSKLCKKVAQLTKVIYHLNTRNEDAEGRLQLLQDDYEAEIESLLQDASAKVAAASEENGGKAAAALAEKVEALEKSYAAEKKKSLEQLESYKAELKATSESKQADAARALKETQGEMQGRITELEAAIKQAQEGKANDKQELEMVVQMHNAKYNEMMAQQLTEQDKLSAALREAEEALRAQQAAAEAERAQMLREQEAASAGAGELAALQAAQAKELQALQARFEEEAAARRAAEEAVAASKAEARRLASEAELLQKQARLPLPLTLTQP